ncbi:MAG: adenylate/guanylate cyclase domain-containing protein [Caulobacteraceae bacterium]|nr:adenylate/guanylate cyclase domain-containing protein [Caulobacteraceae bacterium]
MAEASGLWDLLGQTADERVVAAIEADVASAPDRAVNRINPVVFAQSHGLSEEATISAFVHASRLGLFDMAWNMLCPGCSGVLETAAALKTLDRPHYFCTLCDMNSEPTLDRLVEATFTVTPRVRRIAAHDPDSLSLPEYMRQIFWSSGADVPEDVETAIGRVTLDTMELDPGERASMSLTLPKGFVIAFDPVTHATLLIDVSGEETSERRNLSLVLADANAHFGKMTLHPGPVRITFENKSAHRTLPGLWLHSPEMDELSRLRRPFLTATRLLSNQTFRDLYRSGTFDPEQRFKITSLTILFTDLRGSTELYDRVGDLAAFDLVRSHFGELLTAVSAEGGAVVKTIGDAVMATFPTPDRAIRAAIRMREAMRKINEARGGEDLALNIGLHEGPCLAVMLDDRQDYFGLSVNVASRVQGLADPTAILATKPIVDSEGVARLVESAGYAATSKTLSLRGVSEAFEIFEIREREKAAKAA